MGSNYLGLGAGVVGCWVVDRMVGVLVVVGVEIVG